MKKSPKKNCGVNIRVTEEQRKEIQQLAALSGKESVTEFILETVLKVSPSKSKNDDTADTFALLTKCLSDLRENQINQQITTYIIMQFVMWLNVEHHSREEIMEFYDEQFKKAIEKFDKGN